MYPPFENSTTRIAIIHTSTSQKLIQNDDYIQHWRNSQNRRIYSECRQSHNWSWYLTIIDINVMTFFFHWQLFLCLEEFLQKFDKVITYSFRNSFYTWYCWFLFFKYKKIRDSKENRISPFALLIWRFKANSANCHYLFWKLKGPARYLSIANSRNLLV